MRAQQEQLRVAFSCWEHSADIYVGTKKLVSSTTKWPCSELVPKKAMQSTEKFVAFCWAASERLLQKLPSNSVWTPTTPSVKESNWQMWHSWANTELLRQKNPAASPAELKLAAAEQTIRLFKKAETIVAPVLGWRLWQVDVQYGALVLSSSYDKSLWIPCVRYEADELSVGSYAAGIHAFKTQEQLSFSKELSVDLVCGSVWMWGKMIEYDLGYKSQYAYPKALYSGSHVIKQSLCQLYRCEEIESME